MAKSSRSASRKTAARGKSGKSAQPRRTWFARLRRLLSYTLLFALLAVSGYLLYVDHTITGTFEGRRWSVPAEVYAQPLELYVGRTLSSDQFQVELERSGYQPVSGRIGDGFFRREGNRFTVGLVAFDFIDTRRPAAVLEARFDGSGVKSLSLDGQRRSVLRLDPPQIGNFFASHGEDRIILPPDEVPELLEEGLKAVEDRNYDKHPGFDLVGIARALVVNLRAGEITQGGSTLTQQLVKSYFLDNRRTLERKLRELAMAVILDARFEKEDLLNAYINEIFLGQDGNRAIHGFGLGAQFYFAKPLADLRPHEVATLLAIIRGPSYYNPTRYPERVRDRRNLILDILHNDGLIDATAHASSKRAPLVITRGARRGGTYYPAFMDLVRENLRSYYDTDELGSEGLKVFTTLEPRLQEDAADALEAALGRIERNRGISGLQAAVILSQAQTGEVSALLGGRTAGINDFNRALNAERPTGSLLKPVTYLAALEQGYHLASVIDDVPLPVDPAEREPWQPRNFDGEVHGPVPLVRALGDSLNLATVHLGFDVGVRRVADRLTDLTGRRPANRYPSLLLGAESLSPLDITRLYGNFASRGFYTPPKAVIAVVAEDGTPLTHYPFEPRPSMDGEHADAMNEALRIAMQEGTGRSSRFANAGVAGKTGTSNDHRDSWFAGYDAETLGVVWVGRDDNGSTGLTGASGALRVWDEVMRSVVIAPLTAPLIDAERTLEASVDYQTGLLARVGCVDHLVKIPVPKSTPLAATPGCNIRPTLTDRIRSWFDNN